ncbi:hypothetical protein GQ44DRAFT_724786 [Phaeosphaeriaceae sp. PMI808]|nr:hypothetical protein GQ44DRAFT_724786 [Phaeosphaeriaceae sp. PMI808]
MRIQKTKPASNPPRVIVKARTATLKPASTSTWTPTTQGAIVNSVELRYRRGETPLVGLDHYLYLSSQQEDHTHNFTDPNECKGNIEGVHDFDNPDEADGEARETSQGPILEQNINSAQPPSPRNDYGEMIYKARTCNPAVFLAVIRIAQKNLPSLDLSSAINHLPNIHSSKPLPKLPPRGFVNDTPHDRRRSDTEITIALLPYFYTDGRHALGFFDIVPHAYRSLTNTCVFTPCTTTDLQHFNMLDQFLMDNGEEFEERQCVGSREGEWLDVGASCDAKDWVLCWSIAAKTWQSRLGFCMMGKREDP